MEKFRVQVVGLERIEGVSKQTGRPYLIRRAQVVCQIDGGTFVAKVSVPKAVADVAPGVYDLTCRPYIDREGNLQFAVAAFVPVAVEARKAA
jgi:hypothetical protein